jgi:hypothetical protein
MLVYFFVGSFVWLVRLAPSLASAVNFYVALVAPSLASSVNFYVALVAPSLASSVNYRCLGGSIPRLCASFHSVGNSFLPSLLPAFFY